MRFRFCVRLVSLVIVAGLLLGCDNRKGMKNMQPGSGPEQEKPLDLKGGKKKDMPPEPADPEAPPRSK
jgi:hypothetical protein